MRDICLACYSPAASGRMVAAIPMSTCPLRGYESDSSYETLSVELVLRDTRWEYLHRDQS